VSVGLEDTHFAAEHIEQLRQALEAGVSKEFANRSCLTSPERASVFRIGCGRAEFYGARRADLCLPKRAARLDTEIDGMVVPRCLQRRTR